MAKTHNFNAPSCHQNLSKIKTAAQRKPRQKVLKYSTLISINLKTKCAIKKHAEEMAHDPEALTTEFLIKITGCRFEDARKSQTP